MYEEVLIIRDKNRNEEFKVKGSGELIAAFKLLRQKELKEIETTIHKMADKLNFDVRTENNGVVELECKLEWVFDTR